jgi:hypothetical protein
MAAQTPDQTPPTKTRWRLGRRKFLAQIGVGGLVVAAATFGRSSPAYAATCGCCNLYHCPPNSSYSGCMGNPSYSWRCSYNSTRTQCQCCEQSSGGYHFSAYACWPR